MPIQRKNQSFEQLLAGAHTDESSHLELEDGDRVAVIGGGPSGSLVSYFMLRMADQVGLDIDIDIYEPRNFNQSGSGGCNHCGGIVSESLVQMLATEGVNLPTTVVQRAIDSYMLHMDVGRVRIDTPLLEKRIAAIYRGAGPEEDEAMQVVGFDHYLLDLAASEGANVVRKLVSDIEIIDAGSRVICADGWSDSYDFLVMAVGINSQLLQSIERLDFGFQAPVKTKTYICEFHLGSSTIAEYLGTSMHVFLLDLPRLEFAAIIPKGEFVTACLLGEDIDEELIESFFASEEVRACFPDSFVPPIVCHCFPRLNFSAALNPFADRILVLGDSGVTRLYKDGIGAAYRTAKIAASTAILHGISSADFHKYFWPTLRMINFDNFIGKGIFAITHQIQKIRFSRRAVLRMTAAEQRLVGKTRHLSSILWDLFTGSAPYRDVLLRACHPIFIIKLIWNLIVALWPFGNDRNLERNTDAG